MTYFLHPKLRKVNAVLITLNLMTLALPHLWHAVSAPISGRSSVDQCPGESGTVFSPSHTMQQELCWAWTTPSPAPPLEPPSMSHVVITLDDHVSLVFPFVACLCLYGGWDMVLTKAFGKYKQSH